MDKIGREFQLDEYYLELLDEGNLGLSGPDALENKVRYISQEEIIDHPYPGIRPFKTTEAPIFFGRDGQADKLIEKLNDYNFLGVIGSSGSGKSSLIRAGLIPHLFAGFHKDGSSNWQVAICRPGDDPISNISAALAGIQVGSREPDQILEDARRIRTELNENPYGLLDIGEEITEGDSRLLIVIDQFEELFRFKREVNSMDSHHFVNLLMNVAAEKNSNIYVAITMRSEYLGDCVHFAGLTEAINRGQYLVPRLGRKELKAAIQGPAQMAGTQIDKGLLNKLISEIGDNMDQLPILQHALMRTYENWKAKDTEGDIDVDHYKAAGEMKGALAQHADEIIARLNPSQRQITKAIFQRITDRSSDDRGIRRPSYLLQIYKVCEHLHDKFVLDGIVSSEKAKGADKISATTDDVNEVIEILRHERNAFLMPPVAVQLVNNPVIDISHESIMRNWDTLKGWIAEELYDGDLYKRLDQARRDKIIDDERNADHAYLTGALLRDLTTAHERYERNAAWAARYHHTKHESFQKLLKENDEEDFLKNRSRQTSYPLLSDNQVYEQNIEYYIACIAHEEAVILAKRRRKNLFVWMLVLAFIVSLWNGWFAWNQRSIVERQKYFVSKSRDSLKREVRKLDYQFDTLEINKNNLQFFRDSVQQYYDIMVDRAELARSEAEKANASAQIAREASLISQQSADIARDQANRAIEIAIKYRDSAKNILSQVELSRKLERTVLQLNYQFYLNDVESTPWYNSLNSSQQDMADSMLYGYFDLQGIDDSLKTAQTSFEIPKNEVLALQLASDVQSDLSISSMDRLALITSSNELYSNPLSESIYDSIRKTLTPLHFSSNHGLSSWDESKISWLADGNVKVLDESIFQVNSPDQLIPIPLRLSDWEMLINYDLESGTALIAKKEEEFDEFWEDDANFTFEIIHPDPTMQRDTINQGNLNNYIGASENLEHFFFRNDSSVVTMSKTGMILNRIDVNNDWVKFSVSENNEKVVIISDGYNTGLNSKNLYVIHLLTNTIEQFQPPPIDHESINITNDGYQIYYTNDGKLFRHDLITGDFTELSTGHYVYYSTLSGNNEFLGLSASEVNVGLPVELMGIDDELESRAKFLVYNIATGNVEREIGWPSGFMRNMKFSPDSKQLFAIGNTETLQFEVTNDPISKADVKELLEFYPPVNNLVSFAERHYWSDNNKSQTYLEVCERLGLTNSNFYLLKAQFSWDAKKLNECIDFLILADQENSSREEHILELTSDRLMSLKNYDRAIQLKRELLSKDIGYAQYSRDLCVALQTQAEHTSASMRARLAQESIDVISKINIDSNYYYDDVVGEIEAFSTYAYILMNNQEEAKKILLDETNSISEENRNTLSVLYGLNFDLPQYYAEQYLSLENSYDFFDGRQEILRAICVLKINDDKQRAITILEQAVHFGFSDYNWFSNLEDFNSLKKLESFRDVEKQIKENLFRYEM